MKLIIAGSRTYTNYDELKNVFYYWIASHDYPTEIVSGCAIGADTLGERLAKEMNIPVKHFPADWSKYGKKAGIIRNKQMGDYADALLAVHVNGSNGTEHMITYMRDLKKPTSVMKITMEYIES